MLIEWEGGLSSPPRGLENPRSVGARCEDDIQNESLPEFVIWLLASVWLTTTPPAEAQQAKKVPLMGYLSNAAKQIGLTIPQWT